MLTDLKSLNLTELQEIVPGFKGREVFRFIHRHLKEKISDLTCISLSEREQLAEKYFISNLDIQKTSNEKEAGKVAFKLSDGNLVETVSLKDKENRVTLCVSSQVGCPVQCLFCATGKMGFKRNLTVSEILSQVYHFAKGEKISNIVFMGMGEPFLNYENVLAAARILNHPLGQNIAARKITISTVGIISGIKKLAETPEQFRLAWSLIAPNDGARGELIPSKYNEPIDKIVAALREYQRTTRRRVTLEYVVLKDKNDSEKDAAQLVKIAKQLDSHVNLIPYNPVKGSFYMEGNKGALFSYLKKAGVNVTIRQSRGRSISAACGQLAMHHE
ncbi:23S rRNA (adenine(2503)-C(2))-methyltransferase RlmN [Candidatus Saganbacteria bacterium]|nr:23S rRNA (adenine(2503)-C(2))-methyltransferase RlmN [Candidatus Saganbacteria bacterium]